MLSKLFMWADVCLALQICSCAVTVFFTGNSYLEWEGEGKPDKPLLKDK